MDGKPVTKKIKLRFIDSCRFMASSLSSLARNLSDDQCKNLRWFCQDQEVFKLMQRKGVYHMSTWIAGKGSKRQDSTKRSLLQQVQYGGYQQQRLSSCTAGLEYDG